MKSYIKILTLINALLIVTFFTSCKDDDDDNNTIPTVQPKLTIELDHLAGNKKFYFDSTYITANGDAFSASLFKYYVSNFRLVGLNNVEYAIPESYFLVNLDNSSSTAINMDSLPAGTYKSIKFIIGVDSLRNVSGAQTGALLPDSGMFWNWNTGYIFLKIEGTSPAIPGNDFSYHIGGFQGANINYKQVELSFDGDQLVLGNNTNPELHIVVNVLEIFTNPHTIDMATFAPFIHMPDANAKMIADNYANMFKYDHIHAE